MSLSFVLRSLPVWVAALGYLVDIYDLILFSIVRVPSLSELGLSGEAQIQYGIYILNMQMIGMLLGGIFWGIWGDKKGRLKILFGSIFLYSIANFANGFVHSLPMYAFLRFVAGVGLAGELGAGITLVSEMLPKNLRGYGTTVVATVGVSGAILANAVAQNFNWRTAYLIGGVLGFMLLLLRVKVHESGMYEALNSKNSQNAGGAQNPQLVSRGDFFSLFTEREKFKKYLRSIFIGTPTWFVVGILITFSPEFAKHQGVVGEISAGHSVMFCYLGLVFGDLASGLLSQYFKSRRKAVLYFLIATAVMAVFYFSVHSVSASVFYGICVGLGFSSGYWAVFVTVAAEQFGTNIRATVATTVPNFVRGMVVPITMSFQWLKPTLNLTGAAGVVGVVCMGIALASLHGLAETFGKDLDYVE